MAEWHKYPGGLYKTKKDLYEELEERRKKVLQMGGPKVLEERRKAGQMSARERLDYLFDPGTFTEIGMHVKHRTIHFGMDKRWIPAEGVITGFGKINGRMVVAFSEDYSAMAGTFANTTAKRRLMPFSLPWKRGGPL